MTQDDKNWVETHGTIIEAQRVWNRDSTSHRLRLHFRDTSGASRWYSAFSPVDEIIEKSLNLNPPMKPVVFGEGSPISLNSGPWQIWYDVDKQDRPSVKKALYPDPNAQPQQQPQVQPQPQPQAQPQAQPQVQPLTKEEQIARSVGAYMIRDMSGIQGLDELEHRLPQIKRILDQLGPMVFSSSYKLVSDEKILDEDYEV